MSDLIVFVFRDEHRAPEVFNELRRRDWDWITDLNNAWTVTIDKKGKAKVQLNVDLSNTEASGYAKMWGSLLGATLFVPVTDVMVEATAHLNLVCGTLSNAAKHSYAITPDARWWKECLNLDVGFLRDVGAIIERGGSAIFMLLRTGNSCAVLRQLRDYGGTILRTPLVPEQDEQLRRSFHSD